MRHRQEQDEGFPINVRKNVDATLREKPQLQFDNKISGNRKILDIIFGAVLDKSLD